MLNKGRARKNVTEAVFFVDDSKKVVYASLDHLSKMMELIVNNGKKLSNDTEGL